MSRLRRLVLSDRYFFWSCRVLPTRENLSESEFATLAQVIMERRTQHRFLLTAWVLLPDHWHAIVYPGYPLTISRVLEAIKVGATLRINRRRPARPEYESRRTNQVKCKTRRATDRGRAAERSLDGETLRYPAKDHPRPAWRANSS